MDFFGNLSELISEKGKGAAETAKKVAELANLKGQIGGVKAEIKKNYRKIGEAYYEAYKNAEVSCEFEEYVQSIRDAQKTLVELTHKVSELKGQAECKGCGKPMRSEDAFCPKCGTKVEVEFFDEDDTEETDFYKEESVEETETKEEDFFDDDDEVSEEMFIDDEVEELEEVEE